MMTDNKQIETDIDILTSLSDIFSNTKDIERLTKKVLDNILGQLRGREINFDIATLGIVDKTNGVVNQIETSIKDPVLHSSTGVEFESLQIPLSAQSNYVVQALETKQVQITHSFMDILRPSFTEEECYVLQETSGLRTSVIFPVVTKGESIGVLILAAREHHDNIDKDSISFVSSLVSILGVVVENNYLTNEIQEDEQIIKSAKDKLLEIDKTKDDFLSVASHELRTPMTIIKSYLWMLQSGKYGELNEKQQYYMDTAMKSTERLIALVNDMLNISRVEQGLMDFRIESTDVNGEIEAVIEFLRKTVEDKGLFIKIETEENLGEPKVMADRERFREILLNLVSNSIKFTQSGGITIHISTVENTFIQIKVTDTGVGISEQDISALFKKFGRLDNSFTKVAEAGGTGLGLHIVKLYIQKMGGEVGVESNGEGKGSTFWFTLPMDKTNIPATPSKKNFITSLRKGA